MIRIVFLMFYLFLFSVNNNAIACFCFGEGSVRTAINKADVVLTGKVVLIERIAIPYNIPRMVNSINIHYHKVRIIIERLYKGNVKNEVIEVFTGIWDGGGCGYEFKLYETYAVYATKRNRFVNEGDKVETFVYTDICTRTTKRVSEEMSEIEKYRRPRIAR